MTGESRSFTDNAPGESSTGLRQRPFSDYGRRCRTVSRNSLSNGALKFDTSRVAGLYQFWILDFGFWIGEPAEVERWIPKFKINESLI
jgi:hypothetical protein